MKLKSMLLAGTLMASVALLVSPAAYAAAADDASASSGGMAAATAPAGADPVTPDRLLHAADKAEAGNWLMVNKTYDSNRFSPLDEITPDNVANLKLAFAVPLGGLEPNAGGVGALEGSPLAKDGFLYVSDAWGTPYKIDATTGKKGTIVWICDTGIDKDPSGNVLLANRGVALYQNLVISNLVDGRVVACDDTTGKVVWQVQEGDQPADAFDAAPLVVKDMVIVGQSNGDSATRGFMAALDAKTGKELWRFYTVPSPDQPGGDTWKCDKTGNPDCWKTGGAALWATGSYDPSTNTLYWGTGNPVPMMDPQYRPGRNLYSDSTIAVDADTGKLKWYFQYTPGDYHDYDEVGTQQLVNVKINGEDRKVLAHFGRNGFFYTLDATNGQFLTATQYVNKLTWTKGIDPKTGLPVEFDPNKDLQVYGAGATRRNGPAVDVCPHIQGGMNYWPSAVDPTTGIAYGAGLEGCSELEAKAVDPKDVHPGQSFFGGSFTDIGHMKGSIFAYDVATGKQVAKQTLDYPNYAGVAMTPGLVWSGNMDGTFAAYDAKTLKPLWSINMGNTFQAPPIVYSVGGKEYVAIMGGATGVANFGYPELKNKPADNMLYVFSL